MRIPRVPKWVWWCGVAFLALQTYFFQELISAELLFAVIFGGLLLLVLAIYVITMVGDRGLDWVEATGKLLIPKIHQQWTRLEAISKKTFRHPHSESAP